MAGRPLRRKHKSKDAVEAGANHKPIVASEFANSDMTLTASRAALDRTKNALAEGPRTEQPSAVEMPAALTSQMLRDSARRARVARDLVAAEKHEMAARRLDRRGPREIAAGKYVPAKTNQGKTKPR